MEIVNEFVVQTSLESAEYIYQEWSVWFMVFGSGQGNENITPTSHCLVLWLMPEGLNWLKWETRFYYPGNSFTI